MKFIIPTFTLLFISSIKCKGSNKTALSSLWKSIKALFPKTSPTNISHLPGRTVSYGKTRIGDVGCCLAHDNAVQQAAKVMKMRLIRQSPAGYDPSDETENDNVENISTNNEKTEMSENNDRKSAPKSDNKGDVASANPNSEDNISG